MLNCGKANYTPYIYITVDEMLVSVRGKCIFRVYIQSKPQHCGLKILYFRVHLTNIKVNNPQKLVLDDFRISSSNYVQQ